MKLRKNQEAKQNEQTTPADDVMEELDENEVFQISGAGSPWGDRPRAGNQPIDDDLRGNG